MLNTALALLVVFGPPLTPAMPLQQIRLTCKQVGSCEEAVRIWCDGYRRADGDGDGIPCENVCHSIEQVEEARRQQGC